MFSLKSKIPWFSSTSCLRKILLTDHACDATAHLCWRRGRAIWRAQKLKKSFEYSRSTKFYHYHIGKKFDVFKYKWKNLIREYWYILILGHKLEVYWRLSELKKKCWKHISFYYLPITSILVAKADFCEMFSNIKNSLMITVIAISN